MVETNNSARYKRTHYTHFTVPRLPWHTEDHKFGEGTEGHSDGSDNERVVPDDRDGESMDSVESDRPRGRHELDYCFCGRRGKHLLDRWYCEECWEIGDDE